MMHLQLDLDFARKPKEIISQAFVYLKVPADMRRSTFDVCSVLKSSMS